MYKSTTFVSLFVYTALVAAQNAVTIYDISFVPEPTSGTSGLEDQFNNVLGAVALGGGEIKASAVAVDTAGATYYVGVQEISVLPTNAGGVLTTVVLPTPTLTTFTFRADASRVVLEDAIETTIEGVEANMAYGVECTHDVDADTPVEEGVIICKAKIEIEAEAAGQTLASTIELTTTGQAKPLVTITNPANLNLPTGEPGVPAASGGSIRPSAASGSGVPTPSSTPGADGSGHRTRAGILGFVTASVIIASQLL
ncbi:hypothetical protein BKA70DRAFT_1402337 [Coprinopsis sp. MPI-PUGE-AT-0042]|nr:hypothetical protein BKA70DRAFT_1402337 [Coprinopsis sp. MPI-PUGE-AT-0042]